MDKQKINENEIIDEVYIEKAPVVRLIIISLAVIFLAFLYNFPVKENLKGFLVNTINKNKACPMTYTQMDLSLFMPEISFKGLTILGKCFGNARSPGATFDDARVKLARPTVVPPGVLFKVNASDSTTELNVFATAGVTSANIKVEKSIINGALITAIANLPIKLKGGLSVDALINTNYKEPQSGSFHITSKDLALPPQLIMILQVKGLSLAPLLLKGTLDGNDVKVQKFQIGNSTTKIEAIFNDGIITLDKKNPNNHQVNILGRIRLSAELLKEFPILSPFLAAANIDDNGFYRVQFKGPLNSLRPKFL